MFEYGCFLVSFHPSIGSYELTDLNYECFVGHAYITSGPGAIIDIHTSFLDASQAGILAEFLTDLNSTLPTA